MRHHNQLVWIWPPNRMAFRTGLLCYFTYLHESNVKLRFLPRDVRSAKRGIAIVVGVKATDGLLATVCSYGMWYVLKSHPASSP